ncbi:MAG: CidA/LrgA family protein [Candidatus Thiodiazotropha sp.]
MQRHLYGAGSMGFINGITLLLIYQLIGEVTVLWLELPVPGPVVGMILLFLTLLIRGHSTEPLNQASSTLLSHLSLLFVPAGVGLVVHLNLIADAWLPILLTLVLSTLITLAATAGIFWLTLRLRSGRS